MSIAQRIRGAVERALIVQMERVNQKLVEQAPIPDSTAPPLDELQRILADLRRQKRTGQHVFLKRAA
jgi:protein-tyrosine phosphatase